MTRYHIAVLQIIVMLTILSVIPQATGQGAGQNNAWVRGQNSQTAISSSHIAPAMKPRAESIQTGSSKEPKECTSDQIESMIDARFTLEEIYSVCGIGRSNKSSASAIRILHKVGETFAGCSTYVDQGVQYTKWIKPKRQLETTTFETAFIRPHRLRFEHAATSESGPNHIIVYMDGDKVKSKLNRKPTYIKQAQSLTNALVYTGWIGATIPRLLMPNKVQTWNLLQMDQVERMSDKLLDGQNFYRIKGYHPMGDADEPIILWIDKKTYLIRKIEKVSKSDDYLIKETTIFDAHMDINLTVDRIEFDQGPRLTATDFATKIKPKSQADK